MLNEKRGILNEAVVFEVEVKARCSQYAQNMLSNIQISRVQSPNCLPISITEVHPNPDINDLNAHVLCTDIEGGSIFRFVEIFSVEDTETPAPGDQYIVSWLSNFPFREMSNTYTYMRRPVCGVADDVCSDTEIVKYCHQRNVNINKVGFVQSKDRTYFIPPNVVIESCSLNDVCCPYVSIYTTGICGGTKNEVPPPPPQCPGCVSDFCFTRTCVNSTCVEVSTCDDGDPCTKDYCRTTPTPECLNLPGCYDGYSCTEDVCIQGNCIHTQYCGQPDPTNCYYCTETLPNCQVGGWPADPFDLASYCQTDLYNTTDKLGSCYNTPKSGTCPPPPNSWTFLQQ